MLFRISLILFCGFFLGMNKPVFGQDILVEIPPEEIGKINLVAYSASGKYLVTSEAPPNNFVKFWDTQNFQLLQTLPISGSMVTSIKVSPEGQFVAITFKENELHIWDTAREKIIAKYRSGLLIKNMAFSPDGSMLALCGSFKKKELRYGGFQHIDKSNVLELYDFSKAKKSGNIIPIKSNIQGRQCSKVAFSPDGRYIMGLEDTNYDSKLVFWSSKSFKKLKIIKGGRGKIKQVHFIDETNAILYSVRDSFFLMNYLTNKVIRKFDSPIRDPSLTDMNHKRRILYPVLRGFEMKDIITLRVIWKVKQAARPINVQYQPNGRLVSCILPNGQLEIWDYESRRHLFTLTSLQTEEDFVLISPKGYYHGTKKGVRNIRYMREGKYYPFDEIDLKFNRPELILASLPNFNPEEVAQYEKLTIKRRQLMQKDNTYGNFESNRPELTFISKVNDFSDSHIFDHQGKIDLKIKVVDSKAKLSRLKLSINGVTNSFDRLPKNTEAEVIKSIELSNGTNEIKAEVWNYHGVKSLPQYLSLNYNNPYFTQKVCFFGVGVSAYKNINSLEYAHKDVQDVAQFLKEHKPTSFEVETNLLLNENATQEAVENLRTQLQKTAIDDIVILYFAGHGRRPTDQQKWCFKPYDYDRGSSGISDQLINELIQESPSRKKMIVLDACYSGESFGQPNQNQTGDLIAYNQRGADEDEEEILEAPTIDQIKSTFNDLRNDTGAIIIAASGAKETAFESAEFSNGLFTYHFLKGLESIVADTNFDRKISVAELMAYIHDQMDKSYGQQPNFKRKYAGFDFTLWHRAKKKVRYDQLFEKN